MQVHLFHRAPGLGFYSIEEVFRALEPELSKECSITNKVVPLPGLNTKSIMRNLHYASENIGQINHITGHVHYLAMGLRKNVVLTIHDTHSSFKGGTLKVQLKKLLLYWLPAQFTCQITVISNQTKSELESLIGHKHKITVIPNPHSPELRYTPKPFAKEKPTILHIGSTPNKNLSRTIQALKGLHCRLIIIGRPTKDEEQELSEARIEYEKYSNLPYSEVIKFYEETDIVSFASTYEGFGMPILEGQVIGRPIVTSQLSPMREISGGAAALVDPFDVHSIREGFNRIITSESFRHQIVSEGVNNVKRFHPKAIAQSYLRVYREVLASEAI